MHLTAALREVVVFLLQQVVLLDDLVYLVLKLLLRLLRALLLGRLSHVLRLPGPTSGSSRRFPLLDFPLILVIVVVLVFLLSVVLIQVIVTFQLIFVGYQLRPKVVNFSVLKVLEVSVDGSSVRVLLVGALIFLLIPVDSKLVQVSLF